MHANLTRELGATARALRLALGAACLLFVAASVLAHHGFFYKPVYQAIKNGDLDDIKDRFTKSAWKGGCGALSAAELQQRLKTGKVLGLAENSSHDPKRSKCVVILKLQSPEKKPYELIWLLAEDFDPGDRSWEDWRIVRIVNDEKQAQSFFKHSLPTGW